MTVLVTDVIGVWELSIKVPAHRPVWMVRVDRCKEPIVRDRVWSFSSLENAVGMYLLVYRMLWHGNYAGLRLLPGEDDD